jgi:hypothetical protein
MKFVQHIKEFFFVENGGQRNSQEENEKKIKISHFFFAFWTRASEYGHLIQIFDSVSVIWGLFNIFKCNFARKLRSE